MPGPLDGIRVLEFSLVVAGPMSGVLLSDLGADVIKVEPPGGESLRQARAIVPDEGKAFQTFNRGKRGIVVDLQQAEGRAIIHRLVPTVDVVVVNYRYGVAARVGIDYETLRELRPDLIYVESTGFGTRGELAEQGCSDVVAQAYSGIMAGDGKIAEDGAPVAATFGAPADYGTAMATAMGVSSALFHRERTGEGQAIDIALLDGAVASLANQAQVTLITGRDTGRYGNDHPFLEPFGVVDTADGPLYLVIGNDRQWERFCRDVIGRPELLDHPHFRDNAARLSNREANRALLAEIFASDTRAGWIAKFRASGVPAGAVRSIAEALAAPEVRARGMVHEVDHPKAGRFEALASPVRLSATPTAVPVAAPLLGQHTDAVLAAFGYATEEIARFRTDGVTA